MTGGEFVSTAGLVMMGVGALGFLVCVGGIINWYRQRSKKANSSGASGGQAQGA